MKIDIHFLKVGSGDSFIIMFYEKNETNMLMIDGGFAIHYRNVIKPKLETYLKQENYSNSILLTHIDRDHIGGLIKLFEDSYFENKKIITNVFYNTTESLKNMALDVKGDIEEILINDNLDTSYNQGIKLEELLKKFDIPLKTNIIAGQTIKISENILIKVLGPRKESLNEYKKWIEEEEDNLYTSSYSKCDYDKSLLELKDNVFDENKKDTINASSIAILIEADNKKLMFLGDSYSSDIVKSLNELGYDEDNKLNVDIVKISHHGSKYNTSNKLLNCLNCKNFIISANGVTNSHPNKETLARIIYTQDKPNLFFNHDIANSIFTEEEILAGIFDIQVKEVISL